MRRPDLFWFVLSRMVAWVVLCSVVPGGLIDIQIETLALAEVRIREVVGTFGLGALLGGCSGVLLAVISGIGLVLLTLTFRLLTERTNRYRVVAVATCTVVLLVPAGLLANDYDGVGALMFIPTNFQELGIPLIVSVPFAALGAQKVARTLSRRANAGP